MKLTFQKYLDGFDPKQLNEQSKIDDIAQQLKYHDWTYEYSDDHSVWKRGKAAQNKLVTDIQALSPEEKTALLQHPDVLSLKNKGAEHHSFYDSVERWANPKPAPEPTQEEKDKIWNDAFQQYQRLYQETGVKTGTVLRTKHGDIMVLSVHRKYEHGRTPYYNVALVQDGQPNRDAEFEVDVYTIRDWKKQDARLRTAN